MKIVLAVALLLAGCASAPREAASEAPEADEASGDEVAVALDSVPSAVRAAAMVACPGMQAKHASRETEKGVAYFEISGKTADGQSVDVVLTEAGEVVAVETVVPADTAPQAVRAAAVARLPGLTISRAERIMKKGVVTWEFKGSSGGKVYEIVVAESGEVLEVED